MRLKNKETGAVYRIEDLDLHNCADGICIGLTTYHSLAELNAEWRDVEDDDMTNEYENQKQIGNYFETKEEAEKALEKLKAYKRLKDRNLRFNLNYSTGGATINHKDVILCRIEAYFDDKWEEDNMKAEEDLDLLLGGEE